MSDESILRDEIIAKVLEYDECYPDMPSSEKFDRVYDDLSSEAKELWDIMEAWSVRAIEEYGSDFLKYIQARPPIYRYPFQEAVFGIEFEDFIGVLPN